MSGITFNNFLTKADFASVSEFQTILIGKFILF